jgi:hypothetical protein
VKLTRRHIVIAALACVVVAATFIARNWYYERYVWPREIQQQLLGGLLAPSGSLLQYEGYSHYGQGSFRWRYNVEKDSSLLRVLCGSQPIDSCIFRKARMVSKDVTQSVSYEGGILTVEEDWS